MINPKPVCSHSTTRHYKGGYTGVPGGKVDILGGHSIKKKFM
jgi:hypothetical protein